MSIYACLDSKNHRKFWFLFYDEQVQAYQADTAYFFHCNKAVIVILLLGSLITKKGQFPNPSEYVIF